MKLSKKQALAAIEQAVRTRYQSDHHLERQVEQVRRILADAGYGQEDDGQPGRASAVPGRGTHWLDGLDFSSLSVDVGIDGARPRARDTMTLDTTMKDTTMTNSLPSLIGTDRQVSSATRRRADILRQIDTLIERAEDGNLGDLRDAWVILHAGIEGVTRDNREARRAAHEKWETIKDAASMADYAAALRGGRELLVRETSAKWWIEAGEVVRQLQMDAAQVVLGRFR